MTQYKIISRGVFKKEAIFEEKLNSEARNGWRVISIGYETGGSITKAVLEKTTN